MGWGGGWMSSLQCVYEKIRGKKGLKRGPELVGNQMGSLNVDRLRKL